MQGKQNEALNAFAEDVYYCSLEYGPEDVRSSVGYYNMGKVFQNKEEVLKATACNDMVVKIWTTALCRVVLGIEQVRCAEHKFRGCTGSLAEAMSPEPFTWSDTLCVRWRGMPNL